MQPSSDAQLLREYAEHATEAAFREIVIRHTDLVYSAALRQVDSPDLARDVVQNVFTDLAHKARSVATNLGETSSLAGWLYRGTRFEALNLRRNEFRRHSRERQAMEQSSPTSETAPDWERLRSVLDEAMADLSDADRDALLLRFFKNQDLREVGTALGVSDDAAQKRVSRALEKLREGLSRRGMRTTAGTLAVVLSANTVQAAPLGLTTTVSTSAALSAAALHQAGSIGLTNTLAMTTLQKALITTFVTAALGTGIYEAHRASQLQTAIQALEQQQAPLAEQARRLRHERDDATNRLALLQQQNDLLQRQTAEVPKLRGEVARSRRDAQELAQSKTALLNDPTDSAAKSWLARVNRIKEKLGQAPEQRIPELQFLSDEGWLNSVKNLKRLETEPEIAQAFSSVRVSAKHEFASLLRSALGKFSLANSGQLPADLFQLKPYFTAPIDDAVLQRYELAPSGVVTLKPSPIDDEDDSYVEISREGISFTSGSVAENTLKNALEQFSAANHGLGPTDPSQLLPYIKTPAEQAALQKLIQSSAAK